MNRNTDSHSKVFTIEEANSMLPLIRSIVADLVRLANDVAERRQRLDHLLDGREYEDNDPYSEELAHVEQELEQDSTRLRGYADELEELGVELTSPVEGIVDFPAVLDDRDVFLSWKHDEPEVAFWREVGGDFADRHSLTTAAGESNELR